MYEMSLSWEYSVAALHESGKNKEPNNFFVMRIPVSLVLNMNEWICFEKRTIFLLSQIYLTQRLLLNSVFSLIFRVFHRQKER